MYNITFPKDLEANIKHDVVRMYPCEVIKKYGIVSTYVHDLIKGNNSKKK